MQARCRPDKGCIYNVLRFAVVNVFANFRFRNGVPRAGIISGEVSNIAGRKDVRIVPVYQVMVFSL